MHFSIYHTQDVCAFPHIPHAGRVRTSAYTTRRTHAYATRTGVGVGTGSEDDCYALEQVKFVLEQKPKNSKNRFLTVYSNLQSESDPDDFSPFALQF